MNEREANDEDDVAEDDEAFAVKLKLERRRVCRNDSVSVRSCGRRWILEFDQFPLPSLETSTQFLTKGFLNKNLPPQGLGPKMVKTDVMR